MSGDPSFPMGCTLADIDASAAEEPPTCEICGLPLYLGLCRPCAREQNED